MKTSVIASMLMASMALAAPLDLERRARLTKTETIIKTVYSTTTIYDDEPAPAATSSQGLFYEQPPSSTAAVPTSAPAVPAPVPSSSAAPAAPAPSVPAAQPQVQTSQAPVPSPAAPAPVVTSAAPVVQAQPSVAAAPSSAPAPAPAAPQPSSSSSSSGSWTYTDVDMTVYNGYDSKGACETVLDDSQLFVALSKGIFGDATYNVMTGAPTNAWCGVSITIEYNGKTVTAPVQDRCAGCPGTNDVDLSPAAWTALGLDPTAGGRYKANWSKA